MSWVSVADEGRLGRMRRVWRHAARDFWEYVEVGDCWEWQGVVTPKGYGIAGSLGRAHRVSWERLVGPIAPGLVLDHLCRNRRCVNPDHMEPVPVAENNRRQPSARKTRCKNGHAYTPENTYLRPGSGEGVRICRACMADRRRAHANQERRWSSLRSESTLQQGVGSSIASVGQVYPASRTEPPLTPARGMR